MVEALFSVRLDASLVITPVGTLVAAPIVTFPTLSSARDGAALVPAAINRVPPSTSTMAASFTLALRLALLSLLRC